jgi:hypothetical protein
VVEPNLTVIEDDDGAKPEPVIVTLVPTEPLVMESEMVASSTVNLAVGDCLPSETVIVF